MRGRVAGHAFERTGDIDQAAGGFVPVIELLEGAREGESLVDSHVQSSRNLLGNLIRIGIADVEHAADVADGHSRRHRAEGNDLGNMVIAVEAVDIVNDFTAAVDAEVHIDIRHGDALGIEKALEEETVFDGIDVRDVQAVGNHTARRTAAPWPDGDAVAFGIADKIRHDEEVIHKPHFADHLELISKLGTDFRSGRESFGKASFTEFTEIGIAVRLSGRELEAGQLVVAEFKIEIATIGYDKGIGKSLFLSGEEPTHFFLAFKIELLRLHLHAGGVVDRFTGLDGHEDILIICVFLIYIMGIVGEDERNPRLLMEADQTGGGSFFFRDAMILDFKIEILRPEKIA